MLFTHSDSHARTLPRLATRTLAAAMLASTLLACSSSSSSGSATSSQPAARDEAASTACQQLAHCDQVGPGKAYESADQCDVKQRSFWDSQWPVGTCDGKIDATAYNACLTTISTAACGNPADLANIILNKCSSGTVCSAGPK